MRRDMFFRNAEAVRPRRAIARPGPGEGQAAMKTVPAFLVAALLFHVPVAAQTQPVETEVAGVTAEVVELRQTGGVLRLAVRFATGRQGGGVLALRRGTSCSST